MKAFTGKYKVHFVLSCLILIGLIYISPVLADEPYDPEKILQVPHQSILNNERLPGSSGNTGAMTFSVPIQVAPGRGGLEPELALTYNSSSKQNSWVGVGWSLDLGSIECSKKKRINFNDSTDSFVHNGSIDLVRRPQWGSNCFGARIEEGFTKYIFLGQTSGWEVRMADGRIHRYGTNANSRISTSLGVIKWLLSEIRDANGNSITIDYDAAAGDEYYPQRMNYEPTGSYVRFILEARNDRYPLYTNYTRIQAARRLREIECYGYGGNRAHRYLLSYDYSGYSQRSLLHTIQEFGSSNSTVLPATTLTYESGNTVRLGTSRSTSTGSNNQPGFTHFADVNGDGFTDLIKFVESPNSNVVVFLSNEDGEFGSGITTNTGYPNETGHIHCGDLDGDGKADFVKTQFTAGGKILRC